jgi:hypothetical protein
MYLAKERDATGWKHVDPSGAYKIPACSCPSYLQHLDILVIKIDSE